MISTTLSPRLLIRSSASSSLLLIPLAYFSFQFLCYKLSKSGVGKTDFEFDALKCLIYESSVFYTPRVFQVSFSSTEELELDRSNLIIN